MRLITFLSLIILLIFPTFSLSQDIKDADLAGAWYTANPNLLSQQINNYLKKADPEPIKGNIIAIISPHAGIKYSGQVAAFGFKSVQNQKIDTVIVVGFSHRAYYDGIAVFDKDGFRTPLGILYTDKELTQKLIHSHKKIFVQTSAFEEENSVELILPFIQAALGAPKVILIAIGQQSLENCQILGKSLYKALERRKNYLIVASTDMSHHMPYEEANRIDTNTVEEILNIQPEKLYLKTYAKNRMCGTAAVVSTMIAAKKLGANKVQILNQANSGDATWDKGRVVGYLSAAFIRENGESKMENDKINEEQLLNQEQKNKLLKLARDTITLYLDTGKTLEVKEDDPVLTQVMGAFVTLHNKGQLRGCIGNIIGQKPLYLTVRDMAIASATQDPRFSPVTKDELGKIDIEISALSPLKKITDPDQIILGKHGVLVKDSWRSGVYLPQVATETGWTKEEFMNSLCGQKAGMSSDAWKTNKCEIYIFTAEVFGE